MTSMYPCTVMRETSASRARPATLYTGSFRNFLLKAWTKRLFSAVSSTGE